MWSKFFRVLGLRREKRVAGKPLTVGSHMLALEPRLLFDAAGAVSGSGLPEPPCHVSSEGVSGEPVGISGGDPRDFFPAPVATPSDDAPVASVPAPVAGLLAGDSGEGNRVVPDVSPAVSGLSLDTPEIDPAVPDVSLGSPEVDPAAPEVSSDAPEVDPVASEVNSDVPGVNSAAPGGSRLLVVDSGVRDWQGLVAGLEGDAEVVFLDAGGDGLAEIATLLGGRSGVSELHILAHGAPGEITLGATRLRADNVTGFAEVLRGWGGSLTAGADILLYGCEVGAGEEGVALVTALSRFTGADVAASSDPTGAAALGGDWELEVRAGEVTAALPFVREGLATFSGLLATPVAGSAAVPDHGVRLDGTNDFVNLPDTVLNRAEGSVEMWFLAPDNTGAYDTQLKFVFANKFTAGPNGGQLYLYIKGVTSTQWQLWGQLDGNSRTMTSFYGGQWHHLAATWRDGGSGYFYLDGQQVGTVATLNFTNVLQNLVGVGAYAESSLFFPGTVSDVRIWNTQRTQAQVQSDMLVLGSQVGGESAFYALNEGSGNSVADATGTFAAGSLMPAGEPGWMNLAPTEEVNRTFTLGGYDADGQKITATVASLPAKGKLYQTADGTTLGAEITVAGTQVTDANKRVIFVPTTDAYGADSFTYTVNDGANTSAAATLSYSITNVNDAPTSANGTVTATEDTARSFASGDFTFADVDNDSLVKIRISTLESAGALKLSGVDVALNDEIAVAQLGNLTFTPAANANGAAYATFGFQVHDGTTWSTAAYTTTVDVTAVNDPPTSANGTVTTNEDTAYTFAAGDFSYSDTEGSALSKIRISTLESAGALKLSGVDVNLNDEIAVAQIGNLTFTPAANANGAAYATFGFQVHDGTDWSTAAYTTTVNVTAVNDPPTSANGTVTTNEDTAYTFAAGDFSYSDVEGSALSKIRISTLESVGALKLSGVDVNLNDEIAVAQIGNLTFTPAANANGAGYATFGFQVHDGADWSTAAYTTTVNVTAVNDPPTSANGTVTTNEDTAYTFAAGDFSYGDVEGSALTKIRISTLESAGALKLSGVDVALNDEIALAQFGNLTFTPAANANGAGYATFGFQVHDGTDWSTAAYTTTVDVTAVNDPPTSANGTVTTNEDTAYTFAAGNFSYSDIEGSALFKIRISTLESAGALKLSGVDVNLNDEIAVAQIGNLTFTPVANASGAGYATFGFQVHDGTDWSAAAYTTTIDVTAVNDPPTSANGTVTTNEDTAYTFAAGNFSYSDIEGSALSKVRISTLESAGALKLSGVDVNLNDEIAAAQIGNLTFTPAANANGAGYATFGFQVHDGTDWSAAAYTTTIDVTAVNDAPTSANGTVTTNEDMARAFAAGDFSFSDVEGATLAKIRVTALESAGALQLSGVDVALNDEIAVADLPNLSFIPAANAFGTPYATFRFRVQDGSAWSAADYQMTVNVNSVVDVPAVTAGGTLNFTENGAATVVDGGITVAHGDGTGIQSATLTITGNYVSGKDVLSFVNTASITGSWSAALGRLTLTGPDTAANFQTALRSVTFANASDDPNTAAGTGVVTRTLSLVVTDANAGANAAVTSAVAVTPVNDAPVLAPAGPSLTTITQATSVSPVANVGELLSTLIGASITDVDVTGALEGVAITGVVNGRGAGWQYSTDGGTNWNAVGAVAANSALLLRATDRIRYVSDGGVPTDSASFSYRGWDQTAGAAGSKVNVTVNGGATPYSTASDSAAILINDAPVLVAGAPVMTTINEDNITSGGMTVSAIIAAGGGSLTDPNGGSPGIAIMATDNDTGNWQYNIGAGWNNVGVVSSASALRLGAGHSVRFVPDTLNPPNNPTNKTTFTFVGWDGSVGAAGSKTSVVVRGGATPFSTLSDVATINVTPVNDAPTLTAAAPWMIEVENSDTNNAGQTVAAIIGASVADADIGALEGVALIDDNEDGVGRWQYSLNGGANWSNFPNLQNGQDALLLRDTDLIRFRPNNQATGTPWFDFRAWDRTSGNAGDQVDARSWNTGGSTAFSTVLDTATILINEAPTLTVVAPTLPVITEDETANTGDTVSNIRGASIDDVNSNAPSMGIVVTGKSGDHGTWQYKVGAGAWTDIGAVSTASALLLRPTYRVRFVPDAMNPPTVAATLSYYGWDRATGTGGTLVNVTTRGGATPFSSVGDVVTQTVTEVNDAPVLAAIAPALTTITEDATANGGDLVSAIVAASISDVDTATPAVEGIAITGLTSGNGTWQYNIGGGWLAVGAVANNSALLLRATDSLRFVPDAIAADSATVTYRAWDQTSGAAGSKVSTASNGATTAFSTATDTATITVTAVNDAPVNTVPGAQSLNEDASLVIGGFSIQDIDAGVNPLKVTLAVTNGLLTLTQTTGLTFITGDGTADATMVFTGTRTNLNNAITSLTYAGNANYFGSETLTVTTSDQGFVGAGGVQTDTDTVAITVVGINDAPAVTLPGGQTLSEDTTLTFTAGGGNGLSVADVDAGAGGVKMTLSVTTGSLTLSQVTGLTFTTGDGTADATLVFTGTVASINAALEGMSYAMAANGFGADTLNVTIDDQGNTGLGGVLSATGSVALTVTPKADTPGITNATTNEDTQSTSGLMVSRNAADGAEVTHFKISAITGGSLYLNDGSTVVANDSFLTFAQANAGLKFSPAANQNTPAGGTFSFDVQASTSATNPGLSGALVTATITVNSVNDLPVLVAGAVVTHTEGAASTVVDAPLTVSDVDHANLQSATVTISGGYANGEDGLLFVNQNGITGTWTAATGVLALSGSATLANYQTALRSIAYTNAAGDNPTAGPRTISFMVNDGVDNSATQTASVNVLAVNDAPTVTAGATLAYTEGDVATAADGTVTVSDADNATLASAQVSIVAGYHPGEDVLAFANTGTISGAWDALTGVLSLSGVASKADYRDALRAVTYFNSGGDTPTAGSRTLRFTVNDGAAGSVGADSTVTVTAVDDRPVVVAGGALAFTEGDGATAADAALVVSDVDSANLTGAVVTVSGGYLAAEDTLAFANTAAITGLWNGVTGVLTLTGTTTLANYQAALRSVTYANGGGDNPTAGTRTLTWTVNDGNSASLAVTSTVVVAAANDQPAATAGAVWSYTEGDGATVVDGTVTLADPDNAQLASVTVTLGGGYVNGEDRLYFTDAGGIVGNWSAAGGVLTLTGPATKADFQAALRTVTYGNLAGDIPTAGLRTVTWIANDGAATSNPVTSSLTVVAVNDVPAVTAAGGWSFTEGDPATAVAPAVTVSDADHPQLTGATVTLTGSYVAAEERLYFTDTAAITGSWNAVGGVLTLTGAATQADYQAALSGVTYRNTSENPTAGVRTASIRVSDGVAWSPVATRTITVVAVNDTPTVSAGGNLAYSEGSGAVVADGGVAVGDVDDAFLEGATVTVTAGYVNGEDLLGFADTAAITGVWNAGAGQLVLTGHASLADYQAALRSVTWLNGSDNPTTGARTLSFAVSDGEVTSAAATATVTVTGVNDPPVIAVPGAQSVNEEATLTLAGLSLSDSDLGGADLSLSLAVTHGRLTLGSVAGVTFTSGGNGTAAMVMTGTVGALNTALTGLGYLPDTQYFGADSLVIGVSDQGATGVGGVQAASATVAITVNPLQDPPVAGVDALLTAENTPLVITVATDLFANDSDPDGDALTLAGFTQPANGAVVDNGNGTLTYTPNLHYYGTDPFTYTVGDGQGNSATVTVTLVVDPIPDALTANGDTATVAEDGVVTTANVVANDRDPDFLPDGVNPALAVIGFTDPAHGTAVYLGGGKFTYTPSANYFGVDTFNYTLNAGDARIDTGTVTVTVTAVNDAPAVATNAGMTVNEGATVTFAAASLAVTDPEEGSAALVLTLDAVPIHGTIERLGATLGVGGSFTQEDVALGRVLYRHDGGETTEDGFTFTARDGAGGATFPASVTLTVQPGNDAPVLGVNAGATLAEGGSLILGDGVLRATDADHGTGAITYRLTAAPAAGSLSNNGVALGVGGSFTQADLGSGRVVYLHGGGEGAADGFTFTVDDGAGGAVAATSFSLTLTPVNDAPTLVSNGALTLAEGAVATVGNTLLATADPDNTSAQVGYRLVTLPLHGSLKLDGVALAVGGSVSQAAVDGGRLTYLHDGGESTGDTFRFVVEDGAGGAAAAADFTVVVTPVNDRPVMTAGGSVTYLEDASAVVVDGTLTVTDTDDTHIEGATVTIGAGHRPAEDILAFVDQNGISGSWNGGAGVMTLSGSATLAQYQQALRSVTYRNAEGVNPTTGARTLTWEISDGALPSTAVTSQVTVVAVNDVPVLQAGAVLNYAENGAAQVVDATVTVADGDDTLLEGATVTISSGYAPGEDRLDFVNANGISGLFDAASGRLELTGPATLAQYQSAFRAVTFVNDNGDNPVAGRRTLTFQADDGDGVSLGVTAFVEVSRVNDAPTLTLPGNLTGMEDAGITFSGILVADVDVGGGSMRLSLGVGHGTVTLGEMTGLTLFSGANGGAELVVTGSLAALNNALNGVTYLGARDYYGLDTLAIGVSDLGNTGSGGFGSVAANLGITLLPDQDSPVAGADALMTAEDTDLVIDVTGALLVNDNDPDSDPLSLVAFTQPAHGTVTSDGLGHLVYHSVVDYNGPDQFTYTLSDGQGHTDTTTITVIVDPVADALTAGNDALTLVEDIPTATGNLLANDTDPDYLADGGHNPALAVIGISQAGHGSVNYLGDGIFAYIPNADFNGSDSFTYILNAGDARIDTGTVVITVTPRNDVPHLVNNGGVGIAEGGSRTLTGAMLRVTDPEEGAAQLTYTLGHVPERGRLLLGGVLLGTGNTFTQADIENGNLAIAHDGGEGTADHFNFTVADGAGGQLGLTTVAITVTPVNDAPVVAVNAGLTLAEGGSATLGATHLATTDVDTVAAAVVYTLTAIPERGTLRLAGSALGLGGSFTQEDLEAGRLVYGHGGDEGAADGFRFTVADGAGGTVAESGFAITVTAVNDAPVLILPDGVSGQEDAAIGVGGITVADADIGGGELRLALGVGSGRLTLGSVAGLTFLSGANGKGSLTVTGDVASLNAALAGLTYQGRLQFHGADTLAIRVSDLGGTGSGGEREMAGSVAITVAAVADPPPAAPDVVVVLPGQPLVIPLSPTLTGNDGDLDGDSLVVVGISQPLQGTIVQGANGTVTYTPPVGFTGVDTFTYTVSDGTGPTTTNTVTVVVGAIANGLIATADSVITDEESPLVTGNLLANDRDPDAPGGVNPALRVVGYTAAAHGLVYTNGDGTFTYIPVQDYAGSDSFTYTINAGDQRMGTAVVSIQVNGVNDPPVVAVNTGVTLNEGATTILDKGALRATDPDVADTLTYTVVSLPGHGTLARNGVAQVAGNLFTQTDIDNKRLTYRHDGSENFTDGFRFVVSDGAGGQTLETTFALRINAVNSVPALVTNAGLTVVEGGEGTVGGSLLKVSDQDNRSGEIAYRLTAIPAAGSLRLLGEVLGVGGSFTQEMVDTGALTYAHDGGELAETLFRFTASDGAGGGVAETAFRIRVTGVNDAPVIDTLVGSVVLDEDTFARFEGLRVTDADLGSGSLEVGLVVSNGRITLGETGGLSFWHGRDGESRMTFTGSLAAVNLALTGLTYTPASDFAGSDNLLIQINDQGLTGLGGIQADSTRIGLTVRSVADAPVVGPDAIFTFEDTEALIDILRDLLANDVDLDGDRLTFSSFSQPVRGSLVNNGDGTLTYRPDPDYNGADTFTYTVTDGHGRAGSGTLVLINPIPDSLRAGNDVLTTDEDLRLLTGNLLLNDRDPDYLPNGGRNPALSVLGFTAPLHGRAIYQGDGAFLYIPDPGYSGADSFTYTLNAGDRRVDNATVSITVRNLNDAPQLEVNRGLTVARGASARIDTGILRAIDEDHAAGSLTYTLIQPAVGGLWLGGTPLMTGGTFTQADIDAGRLSYRHGGGGGGQDRFLFSVTDGAGGLISDSLFRITVT
ncbi:MAG: tandem-95 repeat protein, partial [Magnetococcales bacterium]|nr:tandem-95 repeat protein [Magnetococcales bacterium]